MMKLYTWTTPNGYKVPIMLEELGLSYTIQPVDILHGEQLKPAYLKLNPNNKIPTLVDSGRAGSAPVVVFESGAILLYLAEKSKKFLPRTTQKKYEAIE